MISFGKRYCYVMNEITFSEFIKKNFTTPLSKNRKSKKRKNDHIYDQNIFTNYFKNKKKVHIINLRLLQ
jgi:hypothetical protein